MGRLEGLGSYAVLGFFVHILLDGLKAELRICGRDEGKVNLVWVDFRDGVSLASRQAARLIVVNANRYIKIYN